MGELQRYQENDQGFSAIQEEITENIEGRKCSENDHIEFEDESQHIRLSPESVKYLNESSNESSIHKIFTGEPVTIFGKLEQTGHFTMKEYIHAQLPDFRIPALKN